MDKEIKAIDILKDNNISYSNTDHGFIIRGSGFGTYQNCKDKSPEKALRIAYNHGWIKNVEFTNVRVYPQKLYELGIKDDDLFSILNDLGFIILSIEYDSFGPVFFLKILNTDLKLPEYAQLY